MSKPFSEDLKHAMMAAHDVAQGNLFLSRLQKAGDKDEAEQKKIFTEYKELITRYFHMYAALEEKIETAKENAVVKALSHPALTRSEKITSDVIFFFGDGWSVDENVMKPSPAVSKYIEHLEKIAEEKPALLGAHMYVRYLGDLFGGQIMGKKLASIIKVTTGKDTKDGSMFYDFDGKDKELIAHFKAALDSFTDEELQEELKDEVAEAYHYTLDILDEVDKLLKLK